MNLGARSIPTFSGAVSSDANSINDSGEVTGGATTEEAIIACSATINSQSYRTTADGLVSASAVLGTVQTGNCGYSFGYAINSSGQVVGYSNVGGLFGNTTHASLANPGMPMQDLGTLGGTNSTAVSINNAGQIVGYSDFNPSMPYHPHAFLTTAAGPMQDLGTLGGTYISATSINNGGQIVGNSTLSGDAVVHAFIYKNGTMSDLNALIPAGSGWVLENATGINDAGQIVGSGTLNGSQAGFRLDPFDSAIQFQVSPTTLVYPGSTTVSVCIVPATGAPATGTIRILDGTTTVLATLPLQGNGCATWYVNPPLNAGTHWLSALYSGDAHNPSGTSAPIAVAVSPTPSYLSPGCGNAGFVYGGNYNCNINVVSEVGGASGQITYMFDGNPPVSLHLSNGMAQFTLTTPNAGSHKVVIGYAQQGNFAASGPSTQSFTVAPATTQVWLSPSNWFPSAGSSLTLTASVTSYSAAPPPSGTVTFYNNGAVIGTPVGVGAGGTASLTISSLPAGTYSLDAKFGGLSPDYGASTSNYLTIQAH